MTGGHEAREAQTMSVVKEPKKDGRKSRLYLNGADGDRTHDLHVANVALSQLSYCPKKTVSSTRLEACHDQQPKRTYNTII